MPQLWEIVGGADKGGILVREGKETTSAQLKERLSTGALVEEVSLVGERLQFKRIAGTGPERGWISIRLPGKDLAVKFDDKDDKKNDSDTEDETGTEDEEPKRTPPPWKHVQPPQIEYMQIRDLAAKNEPGDYYGIAFPHSKDQIMEYGAVWLTKAFRMTGVLPKSNSVTKITDAREFVGGGAGLKCIINVEYKRDKPYLHKELFAKLPHKPGGSDRYYVSCMWNHDRPEIIFNNWLEQTAPFRVPKFYYGDISASTTNFVLITESIQWSPKGKKEFKAGEVEPAYDKYMDWELPDGGPMYYMACCKALGKMAGLHKQQQLHPRVDEMFPMPGPCEGMPYGIPGADPGARKMNLGKAEQLIRFLTDTAKRVFPSDVTDKAWLEEWKDGIMNYMDYQFEVDCFCRGAGSPSPNDFVGLTHNNLQIDNAFFWRKEDNDVEVGLLDWGVLACGPLVGAVQGCISGAQMEVLVEHRDSFLRCFLDSYAENGGPTLDFDHFKLMSDLMMMGWSAGVIANVAQVLKFTKPKEWETITDWMDPKLCGRFQVRAHCTQFKLSLQLWRKWDLSSKFKEWTQHLGLPERKQ
mmetsp:Transcript_11123/g.25321  ORF Transcript_11123/g.25321 Transcript_11123/m.25321 type:complete len:581 (-) Transcript_11123:120-1862(-)|eukprot:CAMPEP_0197892684 /NCGR_PEP_ID=MMETSP1439-20131203/31240_1 /TAXON_ID=66791 /ORGANISM="Gonyaulax spinifera, Strain CCMP409" /LENGTH=580 /DNA_ID=CAMNT_0043512879 /DNA_START=46 /DNA_END=1788 /DNA_ORIENTATION=+